MLSGILVAFRYFGAFLVFICTLDMMGKSIPLNNGQRKERIFVVTGCSWYLDEMEGMHVSCHFNRVIDILRKGNSNQVIYYFVEKD